MSRIACFALAVALTAGAAHATPEAPSPEHPLKGVVGVCVRWGDDDNRVADAVVVAPSGNTLLDQAIPNTLKGLKWERPDFDTGGWIGVMIAVEGAQPIDMTPDCSVLPGGKPEVPGIKT